MNSKPTASLFSVAFVFVIMLFFIWSAATHQQVIQPTATIQAQIDGPYLYPGNKLGKLTWHVVGPEHLPVVCAWFEGEPDTFRCVGSHP